jgi:hypothetical protein
VLYTQLADEKWGVTCVRNVETKALFLTKEYLDWYKTCSSALRIEKLFVQNGDFTKSAFSMYKDIASDKNCNLATFR